MEKVRGIVTRCFMNYLLIGIVIMHVRICVIVIKHRIRTGAQRQERPNASTTGRGRGASPISIPRLMFINASDNKLVFTAMSCALTTFAIPQMVNIQSRMIRLIILVIIIIPVISYLYSLYTPLKGVTKLSKY